MEAVARTVFVSVWALANTPTVLASSERFPRRCAIRDEPVRAVASVPPDCRSRCMRENEMMHKSMLTLQLPRCWHPGNRAAPAVPGDRLHLFLLVGQSNMAGRGKVEPQDTVPSCAC